MRHGMMGAGACQLVEDRIIPMGYCDLYAPGGACARLAKSER